MTDQTVTLFGLTFRPMDRTDWDTFAGAEEGSLITYAEDRTYILSPDQKSVSEIFEDDNGYTVQRDWVVVNEI